ncbi:MAG: hypothetical protein KIS92_09500 [Planctomycetota bacterium]|nr:hypothetical protein [Planctomycetota bacterium]
MMRYLCAALLAVTVAGAVHAEEKKADPKDPLSKFTDEELADPGAACQKFFEAIASEDAEVVKAFLSEVPKNLAGLDLKKKEDRAAFLKAWAAYKGATVTKSMRIAAAGLAQVTYEVNGAEKTLRWQNVGGRWKYVGD